MLEQFPRKNWIMVPFKQKNILREASLFTGWGAAVNGGMCEPNLKTHEGGGEGEPNRTTREGGEPNRTTPEGGRDK